MVVVAARLERDEARRRCVVVVVVVVVADEGTKSVGGDCRPSAVDIEDSKGE